MQRVGSAAGDAAGIQRRPLSNAEAVLLIDDGHGKSRKPNVTLNQSMRADDHAQLAARQPRQ